MEEFNPYKLEEEKWTPKNVYEILPPNAVSWSDYDFGQGTDNVDQEAANKSFIDGFIDFFSELFGTAGQILGGAIGLGGKVLEGFVNGVSKLIGGIANAISSVFGGGSSESPDLPLFNPIRTNLEALIQPQRDKINESLQRTEEILAEQLVLRGQMDESLEEMRDASRRAGEASERAGEAIERAEAASAAAKEARETLEEYNTALTEQIRDDFNAAVGRADTAVEKAETLAQELEDFKARHQVEIDEAIGKAEQAVADLATLTPKVSDAVSKANKASSDVSTLTPKVTAASENAAKASQDVAALSPKVTDAVNQSEKAISDLSALTTKVSAAQEKADSAYTEAEKVRSEVTPKIEEAQSKGESALAVADKAIENSEFVAGFADDLIPKNAAGKSTWGSQLEPGNESPAESAFGSERTYIMSDSTTGPEPFIPVKGQEVYRVTVWVKQHPDSTNSGFSFHLRSATDHAGWTHVRENFGPWQTKADKSNPYALIPAEYWGKYTIDFRWPESAGPAYLRLQQNSGGKFYIHDPQVRVIAPVDNSVDLAQNDAIRANSEILRQQGEINEAQRVANLAQKNFNDNQKKWNLASTNATQALTDAAKAQEDINAEQRKFNNFQTDFNKKQTKWNAAVDRSIATQDTVNDNFDKWTDGAATAIEANTKAIAALNAPQTGSSIVPMVPGTDTPTWIEPLRELSRGAQTADSKLPESITKYYRYSGGSIPAGKSQSVNIPYRNGISVDPNLEYEASWYTRVSAGSARYVYISMASPETGRYIIEKAKDGEASSNTWGNPVRPLITPATTTWTKHTSRFKFVPGTRTVYITDIHFSNSGNSSAAYFYIADLQISPKVPNQADVDSAQNDAISANTEALKALGKKVLGASLVPYKTPSTKEVEDYREGKLKYDPWAEPEYVNAGHYVWSTSRGRVPAASSSQKTKSYSGSLVSVDSSIGYRVKFSTWADEAGSKMYVYMLDQDGNTAVAETPFCDATKAGSHLIADMTLPKSWKDWSGVIKFKPGVTQVKLATFYWNHSRGTITTRQALAGLEIVPDIPDANVVNLLQDQAILENTRIGKENKKAIDALNDGLDAAIELEEVNQIVGELEGELAAEEKKRNELQEEVDALQTEMIPRTIIHDDRVTYDDYVELSGNKVTAKDSWTGQMAVTYIERTGYGSSSTPYVYKTRVTRKPIVGGATRSWTFSQGIERVDYWVYRGRQRTILLKNAGPYITGSTFSSGTWRVLATHKVGKTYGTGKIEWRANLQYADRGVTYRFKIEVNGTEIKNYKWSGVGPLTSLGSGKRTLKFEHEFSLPDDATVRLLGYAANSNSQQARVSLLQGTLVYIQDTAREASS